LLGWARDKANLHWQQNSNKSPFVDTDFEEQWEQGNRHALSKFLHFMDGRRICFLQLSPPCAQVWDIAWRAPLSGHPSGLFSTGQSHGWSRAEESLCLSQFPLFGCAKHGLSLKSVALQTLCGGLES
jgi:hypothetical protein